MTNNQITGNIFVTRDFFHIYRPPKAPFYFTGNKNVTREEWGGGVDYFG